MRSSRWSEPPCGKPGSRAAGSALLALAACAGPATGPDRGDSGSEGWTVSGMVADLDGTPVPDLYVTASDSFCVPDVTDADGAFSVANVGAGEKRLITYGSTAPGGPWGSVVLPLEIRADVTLSEPVLAPSLPESIPLDTDADQAIETADRLRIDVEAGSLTLAPFAAAELRVRRVPVTMAPAFVPEGVALIDLFVLDPIRSTLDPPAPVAFPPDLGLVEGQAVRVHALDYATGWLVPVATGEVGADGRASTADGQGIPELTWIALSLEEG